MLRRELLVIMSKSVSKLCSSIHDDDDLTIFFRHLIATELIAISVEESGDRVASSGLRLVSLIFALEFDIHNIGENMGDSLPDCLDPSLKWFRVAPAGYPDEGGRLHARVDGRFVTVFRLRGRLSAIDAICHHAGGPLTLGPVEDIEDLGVTVVLCPWHKFMVTVDQGLKAYQSVAFQNGKPVPGPWKLGKMVQRAHLIVEDSSGIYVVRYCLNELNRSL